MKLDDETLIILAGGAVIVGLVAYHRMRGGEIEPAVPLGPALSPYPLYPISPAGPTAALSPTPLTPAPPTPAATSTPPPASAPTAAQNQAFNDASAAAHAQQDADYAAGVADLKARVDRGEVQPGSAAYNSAVDYLANLRGGVATYDAERAQLRAEGLAGRRRRVNLRLV